MFSNPDELPSQVNHYFSLCTNLTHARTFLQMIKEELDNFVMGISKMHAYPLRWPVHKV